MSKQKGTYEVGYKKPPVDKQFRAGQSGNPKGRPKGRKNASTLLNEAINQKVVITENGHQKQITKLDAMFRQLVNKAVQGDDKAMNRLTALVFQLEEKETVRQEAKTYHISEDNRKILAESLKSRIQQPIVEERDDD